MVAVSSAEVFGLITVIRVIAAIPADRNGGKQSADAWRADRDARGCRACARRGVRVTAAQMLGRERPAERVSGTGAIHRFDDIRWHHSRFGAL